MTKRITMLSPIQGGTAYGPLTIAGSPYTVDDALAAELVNRGVAVFTDPPAPTSVYATFVTYMTAAQFAQVAMGAAGVTYEITDVGGRPQYRWNGSTFVSIGTDGGGGSSTPTPISYATTIPLDTAGPGNVMTTNGSAPAGANERIAITANTVFRPSTTRVVDGYCYANVLMNGTNTLDLSAFNCSSGASLLAGGVLTGVANHLYGLAFINAASPPVLPQVGIIDLGLVDTAAPTITAAAVANASKGVINCTTSEPIKSTMPATMTFAVSSGHPLTGVPVYVDSTHFNLATSTPFAPGESAKTLSYTVAPTNPIQDVAGNVLAAFSGLAITNNALPSARVDTMAGAGVNPPSDGGSGWVNVDGTAIKLTTPNRISRASATTMTAKLDTGTLLQDQTFKINPTVIGGAGTGINLSVRFADLSNRIPLIIGTVANRIDLYPIVAGSGSLAARVDGLLLANQVNTIRCYFPDPANPDSFKVDVNGVNIPAFDYTITAAALRVGTTVAVDLDAAEPQTTYFVGLQ